MKLLALDTSSISGSVALLEDHLILAELNWNPLKSHTPELPHQIQKICKQTDIPLSSIDAFAVVHGPGSFTGIRVGLSFIKGLAFIKKKPVVGISSLLALAAAVPGEGFICPMIDARRSQIYTATYQKNNSNIESVIPECAEDPEKFLEQLSSHLSFTDKKKWIYLLGTGTRAYASLIQKKLGSQAIFLDESYDSIHAGIVGQLAFSPIQQGKSYLGGNDLKPHYLRASEAEIQKNRL